MANSRPTLLCIGGSLRPVSYCLATCSCIQDFADAAGFEAEIADPRKLDLPMYVPDFSLEEYAPRGAGIVKLVEAYRRADAMIWVSPTYHGTVSGVFKNMLDFAEFLSSDSPPYLQGRPVGLISVNDSTTFAAMRDCARELRAWLAPTQIELSSDDFDENLCVSTSRTQMRIVRMIEELASFVQAKRELTVKPAIVN